MLQYTFQSHILPNATFFRTFWRNSVFWLLFAFSLFCCRSFFVVTCIVNWLMNEFFLWFCSKIVHRRALLVIIAPHVKCTYVHAFPALDLYLLQRFLWIKFRTKKFFLCQCTQVLCYALAPGVVQYIYIYIYSIGLAFRETYKFIWTSSFWTTDNWMSSHFFRDVFNFFLYQNLNAVKGNKETCVVVEKLFQSWFYFISLF